MKFRISFTAEVDVERFREEYDCNDSAQAIASFFREHAETSVQEYIQRIDCVPVPAQYEKENRNNQK